jgi:hypothetical protein
MIRCSENAPMEFVAASESSSSTYRVRAFLPDNEPPTCFCTNYVMQRNRAGGLDAARELHRKGQTVTCKHIRKILAETCPWTIESKEKQKIEGVCPKCGSPTEDDSHTTVLPENVNKAADVAIASLLALAGDLSEKVGDEDDEEHDNDSNVNVNAKPLVRDKWDEDDLEELLSHLK